MSDDKSCSALNRHQRCSHGHAATAACYGNGYPNGAPVPVCVREDRLFDETRCAVTILKWPGAAQTTQGGEHV